MTETSGGQQVGRFAIQFEVGNRMDMLMARKGLLEQEKIRRLTIEGVVDSGATRLVLPGKVVKQLGLTATGKAKVRYADHRVATREVAEDVYVEIQGRHGVFSAIIEPKRRRALIGAIVLEEMDYLVDCLHQRVVPRDPKFVVSEIE
jgi:predicted aspartyl protease